MPELQNVCAEKLKCFIPQLNKKYSHLGYTLGCPNIVSVFVIEGCVLLYKKNLGIPSAPIKLHFIYLSLYFYSLKGNHTLPNSGIKPYSPLAAFFLYLV